MPWSRSVSSRAKLADRAWARSGRNPPHRFAQVGADPKTGHVYYNDVVKALQVSGLAVRTLGSSGLQL